MQQNLRFPAQCTVIPAEELEQVSGGAPAWVGELKDQIRPLWHQVKPLLSYEKPLCRSSERRIPFMSMERSSRIPWKASRIP